MIALTRNKQPMYYSLPGSAVAIYELDDEGNVKTFIDDEGNVIPIETGEYKTQYGEAIPFEANINGKIKSVIMRSFGADDSANYCLIVCSKNQLPFRIGTLVWRNSNVEFDEELNVNPGSADYVVRGILDEALNEDTYLLRKLKIEDGDV